jgi:two-component system cell cycle sensor histidine kinase/response regulator CckA
VSLDRTGTPGDRRLYASIVSAIRVGLYVWELPDTGDPGDMRLIYANPASVAATGIPIDEVLHRTLRDAFPAFAGTGDARVYAEVARGGEARYLGGVHHRDDLVSDRSYTVRVFPLPLQRVGVAFNDVTEKLALESQLLQSQKLEAVGQLASGVAHDFNNLLTVIEGYAALAQDRLDTDASFVAGALREIRSATASASALTAKLLSLSRKQPLSTAVADLNDLVAGALNLVAPLIGEDITVRRRFDPEAGSAAVDVAQVEQVLVNLAVNARDAMPHGGSLWVSTGTAILAPDAGVASASGRCAWVRVRDDGCGMDAATLAQIFDPFFTTKPAGEGTGLGLSTAFGTIRQAGGRLEASSTPGEGTTFTIWLPSAGEAPSPGRAGDAGRSGGERILLVEDEDPLRHLLADVLRSEGYDVVATGDGLTALGLCAGPAFDLVVTDSVMPGSSGTAIARMARFHHPALPILRISGAPEPAGADPAEPGTTAFLGKPFTLEELTEQVHELLWRG